MVKRATPGEAVRHAVDQTFQAAAGQAVTTRDRAQELVDELAQTAGRLRSALEDLRGGGPDEVRVLKTELERLDGRVSALEDRLASLSGNPSSSKARGSSAARRATEVRQAAAARRTQPARQSPAKGKPRGGRRAPRSGGTGGV
jgi:polyhydroxyalkanoate synthesis regulator phasin